MFKLYQKIGICILPSLSYYASAYLGYFHNILETSLGINKIHFNGCLKKNKGNQIYI